MGGQGRVLFANLGWSCPVVFGGLGHHADTVPAPNQFSIPKVRMTCGMGVLCEL